MIKAIVVGNLGNEPEMKYSSGGTAFLRFNVASNGRVKDQSGNWVDETTWVRVTLFGKRAETLSPMLHKGTRVYTDGRLEARPWTDQQGNIRPGLELMADSVEFMQPRDNGQQSQQRPGDDDGDEAF